MIYLMPLLITAVLLASASQKQTEHSAARGILYNKNTDLAYILLVILLVLFAGLRTRYNDSLLSS